MTTKTLFKGIRERSETEVRDFPARTPTAKPMSDRTRVANREWYPGLCTTCENEPNCTFPRSAGHPVVSCDEFKGAVAVTPRRAEAIPRVSERFAVANREWFPGLCMTCEKRENCTYPKPEGGVFRCDEFE